MKKYLFFIIFGLLFVVAGGALLMKSTNLNKVCTVEATATVVQMIEEEEYDSEDGYSYVYYPVFEYETPQGMISERSDSGSYPAKYKIGDVETILYNPENVEQFYIKGDKSGNIMAIAAIIIGPLVSIIGIVFTAKKEKEEA